MSEEKVYKGNWKECPAHVEQRKRYTISTTNPRIAVCDTHNESYYGCLAVVLGDTPLAAGTVTRWGVKILSSNTQDGLGIFVGLTEAGVDQNSHPPREKAKEWLFSAFSSTLMSGPPQNYMCKPYADTGKLAVGDVVTVVADLSKRTVAFEVNGKKLGVAYEDIPIDTPLAPVVLLHYNGDSVELV